MPWTDDAAGGLKGSPSNFMLLLGSQAIDEGSCVVQLDQQEPVPAQFDGCYFEAYKFEPLRVYMPVVLPYDGEVIRVS